MATDYTQIPIVQCSYQLAIETQRMVARFPKTNRLQVGERLAAKTLDFFESVTRANFVRDAKERGTVLSGLSADIFALRMLFRIAKDLRCISVGQYGDINIRIEDIHRQLTGWTKWTFSQVAKSTENMREPR